MMDSAYSLLGAFLFLVAGVIDQALLQRFIYPLLRRSHEKAKMTGTQTFDPARFMLIMRFVNLIVLPFVGFLFGGRMFNG